MLNKDLQKIFDKYKKDNWLSGNFIPPEEKEKYRIMFIGQKPASYFTKNPDLEYLGNYNATFIDMGFQCFLKKYKLGKIYVTDMVKTKGDPGVDFKKEWNSNLDFKKCLEEEIIQYKPKVIVLMGNEVKEFFNENFGNLNILKKKIYHPAYLCMNPNATIKWDKQFKELRKLIKKTIKNHDKN